MNGFEKIVDKIEAFFFSKQSKRLIALVLLIVGIAGYTNNFGEETFLRYLYVGMIGFFGGYLIRNMKWKDDDNEKK